MEISESLRSLSTLTLPFVLSFNRIHRVNFLQSFTSNLLLAAFDRYREAVEFDFELFLN